MRVYFAANPNAAEKYQKIFTSTINLLHSAGVVVMSNLAAPNIATFSTQDLDHIRESGELMLGHVDGLLIEATNPPEQASYLVAVALAHRKPVLYLLESPKQADKNLKHLSNNPSIGKLLQIKQYVPGQLDKILLDFITKIEKGSGKELPRIKFTLRITSRIERYLQWKTNNTKLSKADYLRNMIEELIERDENYKQFVKENPDQ